MSIESMAIALHHSAAKGATKLVLLGIANHDGDGGAWPSISTLQKYAGVNRRNVQQAITRLEALGEIRRHFQDGGTASLPDHLRPNRYDFTLRCPSGCDRSTRHDVEHPVRSGVVFSPGAEVIAGPWVAPRVAGDTPPRVAGDTPPRVAGDTQTLHEEPSMKHPVYVRASHDRRPEPMATEKQKRYLRHMRDVIGDMGGKVSPIYHAPEIEAMTCRQADGAIEANMGDYQKAARTLSQQALEEVDRERRRNARSR